MLENSFFAPRLMEETESSGTMYAALRAFTVIYKSTCSDFRHPAYQQLLPLQELKCATDVPEGFGTKCCPNFGCAALCIGDTIPGTKRVSEKNIKMIKDVPVPTTKAAATATPATATPVASLNRTTRDG